MSPRVTPEEFASDAVERMSGARLRAAPRVLSVDPPKPSLLVIGDEVLRPLLDRFDSNRVDIRWVREPMAHGSVFEDTPFDLALIHANTFERDAHDVWSTLVAFIRDRPIVIVGHWTNLPPTFKQARAPLILSSRVPISEHYASIQGLLEGVSYRSYAAETASVPSEIPHSRDPSHAVIARLTKELANLSMTARPALVALEELAQKDGVTLEHATILANSWKRIDDCLRDVTTLLDAPTESQTIQTLRVLERFVDDYIEHVTPTQRFISRLAQSLWPVRVAEAEFRLLCKLLLENARRATQRGGEVLLEADNATIRRSSPELPDLEPSDYVRVRVCDNGVGMTPMAQRHAKELFYSTYSTDSNWKGLGLAQADAICRRALGALTIQTREGLGTIVTAWLRRSEVTATTPNRYSSLEVAITSKFLLVDNEPNVLLSLANGLGKRGHSAMLAQDALTALTLLDEEPNFDFAVIDLHLDRDSGLSLARTIAEKFPKVRIMLCSGFADTELSKELLHPTHGAFGFLRKPFDACELLDTLHVASPTNGEE